MRRLIRSPGIEANCPHQRCMEASLHCRRSRRAAAQLMRQLQPLMGERRQGQIDAALEVRERSPQQVRRKRNIEIAQRLAGGEKGPALALEYGVTHQNIYYIGKRYCTAV